MSEFEREYFERRASYASKGGYGAMAADVRRFYAVYFGLAMRLVPELSRGKGKRALEVGCALGVGVEALRRWDYDVYATDVSEYAINEARLRFDHPQQFAVADAQLPNPFGLRFDLVVAIHVVEHLAAVAAGIKHLADAVRAGGHLLIATPNPQSISPYRRFQRDPTHINEHPPGRWVAMLQKLGLTVLSCGTYHVIPVVHRWLGLRYARVPQWMGYDTVIVARSAH